MNLIFVLYFAGFFAVVFSETRTFKNSKLEIISLNKLVLKTDDSDVNFFVLGDWGGLPTVHRTPVQKSVANLMGEMGPVHKTKFQIGLGDNFYILGVKDVDDHRFVDTFEKAYYSEHLINTPWFHVLGNHDHYGNASAQIQYMKKSNRWIMPDYNYTVDIMAKGKKLISLIMLDTIKLCGNNKLIDINKIVDSATFEFPTKEAEALAQLYFKELDDNLKNQAASKVPYILVGGHFPVFSASDHGPMECLKQKLLPLLHKHKVSAYLCGHDHNLQHITHTVSGTTVEYIVAGPNSWTSHKYDNEKKIPKNSLKFKWPTHLDIFSGGFLMIHASIKNMTVDFMKADRTTLYQKVILPRK